ncbi:MAG: UDP-N-acetylglucosamine 2-epimerase (non-hydrolyzing) [Candidatus Omnitrophica bacterium]|nr:UDP-N-acetylglucosamine 2-epimerase (non-hydrolyzing) [Candidatus Omnitrophota bacterium]
MKAKKILFVFGTRPEALKLAPLILSAQRNRALKVYTCLTAQHRQMVDQVLELFKIRPDFDLNIMTEGQTLSSLTQKVLESLDPILRKLKPGFILVQGDTTTAFAAALQGFYHRIPVAHVEAGLRSFNKLHPYPEEINRVLISRIADYHFAPTQEAAKNLLKEGVSSQTIFVTGNTVVDALKLIRPKLHHFNSLVFKRIDFTKRIILVTAHRRENFGKPILEICRAMKAISEGYPDTEIVYPVHLNPNIKDVVFQKLGNNPRIHLLPPLSYTEFLVLMDRSYLILTDSGGIQEEAPSFGKPVLVMREVSERNEGIHLGVAKLVGTSFNKITSESKRLLDNPKAYQKMVMSKNPYGDGHSSERILKIILKYLS